MNAKKEKFVYKVVIKEQQEFFVTVSYPDSNAVIFPDFCAIVCLSSPGM